MNKTKDKNFRQYLETIMVSKKILSMGTQKARLQKTYQISVGPDSLEIDNLIAIDNLIGSK